MTDLAIAIVLLLVSALFSGTEVAYTSLSLDQIEKMRRGGRTSRLAAWLHDRLDTVLTTITIGNNLANLAASALVTVWTTRTFGEGFVGVSTGALTLLVIVFGEVTPKQIGFSQNDIISRFTAPVLNVANIILFPFVIVIRAISGLMTRVFARDRRERVTLESLSRIVRYAGSTGVLDRSQLTVMTNFFRSIDVQVEAIMTHRTKVFSLERSTQIGEAIDQLIARGYSRAPVYSERSEQIVGTVVLKDLIKRSRENGGSSPVWEVMLEPVFIPESRSIYQMLSQFRKERLNLAVVLDEYGGLSGVITVEDIVEELFGELYDEHEKAAAAKIVRVEEGEFLMDADTPVHVVNDHTELNIPSERDAQTIGGYILQFVERMPVRGERLDTPHGTFVIESLGPNRIAQVRLIAPKGD